MSSGECEVSDSCGVAVWNKKEHHDFCTLNPSTLTQRVNPPIATHAFSRQGLEFALTALQKWSNRQAARQGKVLEHMLPPAIIVPSKTIVSFTSFFSPFSHFQHDDGIWKANLFLPQKVRARYLERNARVRWMLAPMPGSLRSVRKPELGKMALHFKRHH